MLSGGAFPPRASTTAPRVNAATAELSWRESRGDAFRFGELVIEGLERYYEQVIPHPDSHRRNIRISFSTRIHAGYQRLFRSAFLNLEPRQRAVAARVGASEEANEQKVIRRGLAPTLVRLSWTPPTDVALPWRRAHVSAGHRDAVSDHDLDDMRKAGGLVTGPDLGAVYGISAPTAFTDWRTHALGRSHRRTLSCNTNAANALRPGAGGQLIAAGHLSWRPLLHDDLTPRASGIRLDAASRHVSRAPPRSRSWVLCASCTVRRRAHERQAQTHRRARSAWRHAGGEDANVPVRLLFLTGRPIRAGLFVQQHRQRARGWQHLRRALHGARQHRVAASAHVVRRWGHAGACGVRRYRQRLRRAGRTALPHGRRHRHPLGKPGGTAAAGRGLRVEDEEVARHGGASS